MNDNDQISEETKNQQIMHQQNDAKSGKMLVFLNPQSGQGRSAEIFSKKFMPILKSKGVKFELITTKMDRRVCDVIKEKSTKELEELDSIVVVSGDGLFHELINSLMLRQDFERAINVPLGIVPAGSGNGLAYTLARRQHPSLKSKDELIKFCCEQTVAEETCCTDLVKLSYGSTKIWSFLSIGWGLLSDIDIDSEWLRFLGELRFTLYALLRSLTASAYYGTLSYKPVVSAQADSDTKSRKNQKRTSLCAENCSDQQANEAPTEMRDINDTPLEGWIHIKDKFACLYAVHQAYISGSTRFAPQSTLNDGTMYLTFIRGKLNPYRAIEFFLAMEDGKHDTLPYVTVVPVDEFEFQPLDRSRVVVDGELISWKLEDGPIRVEVVPKVLKLLTKP